MSLACTCLTSPNKEGSNMEILNHDQITGNYTEKENVPFLEDELLTTKEVADYFKVDRATLYRWRRADTSPRYYNLNGKVMYKKSDLNRFLNQNKHTSLQYR